MRRTFEHNRYVDTKDIMGLRDSGSPLLTVCMIIKNEEANLPRCLDSIKDMADEIVVVDTGSTDRSVEIARQYNARVGMYPWDGSFSNARNVSLDMATGDWIFVIDADEELPPGEGMRLRKMLLEGKDHGDKDHSKAPEGYYVTEVSYCGDESTAGEIVHVTCRVFRNRPRYRFSRSLHEQISQCIIDAGGQVAFSDITLVHYGYLRDRTNLDSKIWRNISILKSEVNHRDDSFTRFNLGTEYMRLGLYSNALAELKKAFALLKDLRSGYAPTLLNSIAVCLVNLERYDESLDLLDQALEAYPNYTDLSYLRALTEMKRGSPRGALECLKECIKSGDASAFYVSEKGLGGYKALTLMALVYKALGQNDKALEALTVASRQNPRYGPATFGLGRLWAEVKGATVHELFDKLEQDGSVSLPARTLVWLSYGFSGTEQYTDALEALQLAYSRGLDRDRFGYETAKVLMKLGRYVDAKSLLESLHHEECEEGFFKSRSSVRKIGCSGSALPAVQSKGWAEESLETNPIPNGTQGLSTVKEFETTGDSSIDPWADKSDDLQNQIALALAFVSILTGDFNASKKIASSLITQDESAGEVDAYLALADLLETGNPRPFRFSVKQGIVSGSERGNGDGKEDNWLFAVSKEKVPSKACEGQDVSSRIRGGTGRACKETAVSRMRQGVWEILSWLLALKEFDKFEKALGLLEWSGQTGPDTTLRLAKVYYSMGYVESAAEEIMSCIARKKEDPWGYKVLGSLAVSLGFKDEAEVFLRRALELEPRDIKTKVDLFSLQFQRGRYEEAQQALS